MTISTTALLVSALLLTPLGAGDHSPADPAELARRLGSYPERLELIRSGPPVVPELLEVVARGSEDLATTAAETVRWIVSGHRGDPEARRLLIDELAAFARDEEVAMGRRSFAVDLLGDLGAGAVASLEQLVALPGASDTAVLALERIPGEEARRTLVGLLDRPGADRALVLEALGRRGETASIPVLVAAAERGEAAALGALALTDDTAARDWLVEAAEAGSGAALEALLDDSTSPLDGGRLARLLAIADDSGERRRVLAKIRSPEQSDPTLVSRLLGSELEGDLERDRFEALLALAPALEPDVATRVVVEALALAPDPILTPRAIGLCIELCPPSAAERLTELARADDPDVALAAVRALGQMEGEAASEQILAALDEAPSGIEASTLVRSLGDRADPVAVQGLIERLEAAPAEQREALVEAALAMASTAEAGDASALWAATLDVEPTVTAIEGLGRAGGTDAVARLAPLLRAGDPLDAAARSALVAIGRRLASAEPGPDERQAAISALRSAFEAGADVAGDLRLLGERLELVAQGGRIDAWWHTRLATETCATAAPPTERLAALDEPPIDTAIWRPIEAPDPESPLELPPIPSGVTDWLVVDLAPRGAERGELVVLASRPAPIWLNGELLPVGASPSEDGEQRHAVSFLETPNRLVVRICGDEEPLRFGVRLEDAQGRPLKFRMR